MNAIVTGASGGIGQEITKKLLDAGYNVIGIYNKNEIKIKDSNLKKLQYDFSNLNGIENLVSNILKEYKTIDVLINNAGISKKELIQDLSIDEYLDLMNINLNAPYVLSKYIVPNMVNNKDGNIINISSIWGETGGSCEVAYSASKAGLIGFTKALAKEVGPSGIRVNAIAPGIIDTKMNVLDKEEKENIIDEIPLQKIGSPEDVSNAVEFLLENKYITGQTIAVNGGWYI